jgi:hypothetical protein
VVQGDLGHPDCVDDHARTSWPASVLVAAVLALVGIAVVAFNRRDVAV